MAASTDSVQINFAENGAEKELRIKKLADVRRCTAHGTHGQPSSAGSLCSPPASAASVPGWQRMCTNESAGCRRTRRLSSIHTAPISNRMSASRSCALALTEMMKPS